jgi:hypothetical protein
MVVHYNKSFIPAHITDSTSGQWHVSGSSAPPRNASVSGIYDAQIVLVVVFL